MLDNSLVFRYDYEVPIGAVIDYAVSRPDVDPDRIAAIGYSMGGYFVPRAAAYDKRIAACVADCLLPDAYTPMVATMEMDELITAGAPVRADQLTQKQRYSVEEGMPRFGFTGGVQDIQAWGDMLKKMNLAGLEDKITCPPAQSLGHRRGKDHVRQRPRVFRRPAESAQPLRPHHRGPGRRDALPARQFQPPAPDRIRLARRDPGHLSTGGIGPDITGERPFGRPAGRPATDCPSRAFVRS